jgi:hypothetical protein
VSEIAFQPDPDDPSGPERLAGAFESFLFPRGQPLELFFMRFASRQGDYVLLLVDPKGSVALPFWPAEEVPSGILAEVALKELAGMQADFVDNFSVHAPAGNFGAHKVTSFLGRGDKLPELNTQGELGAVWAPLNEVQDYLRGII